MNAPTARVRCPVCGFDVPPDAARCSKPFCGVEVGRDATGRLRPRTFRLDDGYTLCVFPFALPDDADAIGAVDRSERWKPYRFAADDPVAVERTEYFLPYIRRFLFPGVDGPADARSCRRWEFDLARLGPAGPHGVPLTLRCRDVRKDLAWEHALTLEGVELILFRHGVGFLTLRFRGDADATFFEQMNAAAYLRAVVPLFRGYEMATLTCGTASFSMPRLLAYLLADLEAGGAVPSGPTALANGGPSPVRPIHDDRMMVYTFSCIDRATCPDDLDHADLLLGRASLVNLDPAEVPPPSPGEDVRAQRLRTRRAGFAKDGGVLVAFDADEYHRRYLGVYHGTYYFDIFLLAALQRVTLLTMSERLADIAALTTGDRRGRRRLARVRRDLLLFKNQCCTSQVTNRERGLALSRRWHDVFENRVLLAEVNDQSAELEAYLTGRARERMDRLVKLGGFLATAVPAVLGLEVLLPPERWGDWVSYLRWALFAALLFGSGLFAWWAVFRKDEG